MNVINKFLIPALALGMFAACSDDNKFEGPETPDNESSVTMSISVQLPTAGSRATNIGNPDTEAGSVAECTVNNLIIVLADKDFGFIDYADATINPTNNSVIKCDASFSISTISNYLNSLSGTTDVTAFAFCNYSSEFASYLNSLTKNGKNTDWIDQFATVNSGAVNIDGKWNESIKSNIPMSNKAVFVKALPAANSLSQYTKDTPFELSSESNPIEVERSVARLDFKDGSKLGNYTYNIYSDDDNSKINVVLERIGLVNMSNRYYYLRHTAPNGASTTVADLTKKTILDETMPWIVDVDTDEKSKYSGNSVSANFLFPVTGTNGAPGRNLWFSTAITDFSKAENDNDSWTGEADYKVWRYVTENTIPVANLQKNGQSTGIVFKAKFTFEGTTGIGKKLADAKTAGKPILFFQGSQIVPLGTIDDILADNSELHKSYKEILTAAIKDKTAGTPEYKKAIVDAGFIIYEPAEGGESALGTDDTKGEYYMYYYYWNRHNDNGKLNVMDAMEFGVVRNTIYKLKVTDISGLGHPRKPENDPDPQQPEDPDEEGNIAISIAVKAVDWSVRENGIEF